MLIMSYLCVVYFISLSLLEALWSGTGGGTEFLLRRESFTGFNIGCRDRSHRCRAARGPGNGTGRDLKSGHVDQPRRRRRPRCRRWPESDSGHMEPVQLRRPSVFQTRIGLHRAIHRHVSDNRHSADQARKTRKLTGRIKEHPIKLVMITSIKISFWHSFLLLKLFLLPLQLGWSLPLQHRHVRTVSGDDIRRRIQAVQHLRQCSVHVTQLILKKYLFIEAPLGSVSGC